MSNSVAPVFVVGTPRSGTTLAAKILGRHPSLFMPGETHFFDDIDANRRRWGPIDDPGTRKLVISRLSSIYGRYFEPEDQLRVDRLFADRAAILSAATSWRSYGDALAWFMELQANAVGKLRWGNNAPRDIFNFRRIVECFPEARFVVCVRDPRAFIVSYKYKWQTVSDLRHRARVSSLFHPVVTTMLWKSSARTVSRLQAETAPGRSIVVRYEDLVSRTESTVRDVCEVIGMRFEPQMLEVDFHNSSAPQTQRGIYRGSIDRWQREITQEEVAIVQLLARDEMNRLGYSEVDCTPRRLKMAATIAHTPWALTRAIYANRDVRGPLLPYLWKRVATLLKRQSRMAA